MRKLDPRILEALGLAPDTTLREVSHDPAPPPQAGQADFVEILDGEILAERISRNPILTPLREVELHPLLGEDAVYRWDVEPSVVVVAPPSSATCLVLPPGLRLPDGRIVLPGRHSSACALVDTEAGEVIFEATCDGLSIYAPRSPDVVALEALPIEPPVDAPAPDVDAILAGFPHPAWLAATAHHLANSVSTVSRIAAAGLAGRLWSPPKGADMEALADRIRDGDSPLARARIWAAGLDARVGRTLEQSVFVEAEALEADLSFLEKELTVASPDAPAVALAWLHRRDDLACVLAVRPSEILAGAIGELDRAADAKASLWLLLPSLGSDDRLRAVSWQDPEAWWGALCL